MGWGKKAIHEIVADVAEQKTKKGKVKVLQENDTQAFRDFLAFAYNKNITWVLPEGAPPFESLGEDMDVEGRLWSEIRKLQHFVAVPNERGEMVPVKNTSTTRRENMFIDILESVDPNDARVLIQAKDRDIPGVTKASVKEAFPEIQGLD